MGDGNIRTATLEYEGEKRLVDRRDKFAFRHSRPGTRQGFFYRPAEIWFPVGSDALTVRRSVWRCGPFFGRPYAAKNGPASAEVPHLEGSRDVAPAPR